MGKSKRKADEYQTKSTDIGQTKSTDIGQTKSPDLGQRKARTSDRLWVFSGGCLLGAVCFLLIYGVRILNPAYDDWLLLGDMDLKQHYIGFCHFRVSSWQFPIGLIETLSYPNSMSVIYTDSIPVLAVLFKLFAYVLPQKFQYFGLAGLLSFMLMGGFSGLLLYRFLNNKIAAVIYSVFFIVSYPIIQRMYYHTALASQWILIAALTLWLYQEELSLKARALLWSLFGFLCVSIHSYFLPMTGLILLCAGADEALTIWKKDEHKNLTDERGAEKTRTPGGVRKKGKRGRKEDPGERAAGRRIWVCMRHGFLELSAFCVSALLALWIYGAFYGESNAVGEGLGTFTSNLNTFVNPLEDGRLYGALPTYNGFQYEGFGYLGGGIMLLLITGLIALGGSRVFKNKHKKSRKKGPEVSRSADSPEGIFRTDYRVFIAAGLFAVTCMLSMFPIVTLNDKKLFGVPYPGFVRKVLGIFRSNGRFIWTAVYLLMLLAITLCYRMFYASVGTEAGISDTAENRESRRSLVYKGKSRWVFYLLTVLALSLQFYDISGMLSGKHDYFAKEQTYTCFWEDHGELRQSRNEDGTTLAEVLTPTNSFKGFVFLYNENDILMDSAYYAYLNGMWQNNYYYARDINPVIDQNVEEWKATLLSGYVRDDIIYVFRKQDISPELSEDLKTFSLRDHIIGIRKNR